MSLPLWVVLVIAGTCVLAAVVVTFVIYRCCTTRNLFRRTKSRKASRAAAYACVDANNNGAGVGGPADLLADEELRKQAQMRFKLNPEHLLMKASEEKLLEESLSKQQQQQQQQQPKPRAVSVSEETEIIGADDRRLFSVDVEKVKKAIHDDSFQTSTAASTRSESVMSIGAVARAMNAKPPSRGSRVESRSLRSATPGQRYSVCEDVQEEEILATERKAQTPRAPVEPPPEPEEEEDGPEHKSPSWTPRSSLFSEETPRRDQDASPRLTAQAVANNTNIINNSNNNQVVQVSVSSQQSTSSADSVYLTPRTMTDFSTFAENADLNADIPAGYRAVIIMTETDRAPSMADMRSIIEPATEYHKTMHLFPTNSVIQSGLKESMVMTPRAPTPDISFSAMSGPGAPDKKVAAKYADVAADRKAEGKVIKLHDIYHTYKQTQDDTLEEGMI